MCNGALQGLPDMGGNIGGDGSDRLDGVAEFLIAEAPPPGPKHDLTGVGDVYAGMSLRLVCARPVSHGQDA